jgi:uncharacterized protein (DUF1015 family)
MPRIFPFEALVYDPDVAGPLSDVTAPPYDVISEARRRGYQSQAFSIVKLDLVDPATGDGYARAGELLAEWIRAGALRRRPAAFQAYEMWFRQDETERTVRGLLCALELEGWGGSVLPHERTMPGPLEDRLRLLRATRTHMSPVYMTFAGPCPDLADLLTQTMNAPPDAETIDEEGVAHRRWTIRGEAPIASWLATDDALIADGHHRYATALAYREEMRERAGPGPWDRLLVFLVDASAERLDVRPFHRIQRSGSMPAGGLPVDDLDAVLAALEDDDPVVGLVLGTTDGPMFRTLPLAGEPPAVRALHRDLLDGRVPPDALGFTPDAVEAVAAVRAGTAVGAYLLPPTTPDRIREVVERGERLPQKSTYFWPKPRTGMTLMPLDERGSA